MASITYAYTPANGAVLDRTGINGDLYSTTSGVSIYGELNGGLDSGNMVAGWKLKPGMLRVGDSCVTSTDGWTTGQTIGDRLFSASGAYASVDADWIPVAACSTRVFLDRTFRFAVYNISAFMSCLRHRSVEDGNPEEEEWGGPEISYRISIDGVAIAHSERTLPYTWYPETNPGKAIRFASRENVLCRQVCQSHLAKNNEYTQAGWHDVCMEVLIPRNTGIEQIAPMNRDAVVGKVVDYNAMHRITLGVVSATIVGLG